MKQYVLYIIGVLPAIGVSAYISVAEVNSGPVFTSLGLIYAVSGASLALASDWNRLRQIFVPTEKINRIQSALDNLYANEIVQTGDKEYDELLEFVKQNFEIPEEPDCISTTISRGAVQTSSRVLIYGTYREEGEFPDDILDMDSWTRELRSDDYETFQIAQLSLFNARISQYIVVIEREAVQFPLRFGWFLLVIGFLLQLVPNISGLGLNIGFC